MDERRGGHGVERVARSRTGVGIAALWGLAEATVFFIVPDAWISLMAAFSPAAAARGVVAAVAGAMAGGAAVYAAGDRMQAARSAALLDRMPAISAKMIFRVEREMAEGGTARMLTGPLRGTPYKIYARTAGLQRQPFVPFLLWTVPARAARFMLVAGVAAALGLAIRRRTANPWWVIVPWVAAWTTFYAWYFRRVRG